MEHTPAAPPPQRPPYYLVAHRLGQAVARVDELELQLAESRGIVRTQGIELDRLWHENKALKKAASDAK